MATQESRPVADMAELVKLLDAILGRVKSVQALCRLAGVSESAYRKWLNGDSFPRVDTIDRLRKLSVAPYLDVPAKGSLRTGRLSRTARNSLIERMNVAGLWPPKQRAEKLSLLIARSGQSPSRVAMLLGVDRKTLADLLNPTSQKVMSEVAITNYGEALSSVTKQ